MPHERTHMFNQKNHIWDLQYRGTHLLLLLLLYSLLLLHLLLGHWRSAPALIMMPPTSCAGGRTCLALLWSWWCSWCSSWSSSRCCSLSYPATCSTHDVTSGSLYCLCGLQK